MMIPHMLVWLRPRCLRDVWDHALHKFTRKDPSQHGSIIDELLKGALGEQAQAKLKGARRARPPVRRRRCLRASVARRGNLQAFRVAFDGFAHLATIELRSTPSRPPRTTAPSAPSRRDLAHLQVVAIPPARLHAWPRELRDLPLARHPYNIEASRTVHHSVSELRPTWASTRTSFLGGGSPLS